MSFSQRPRVRWLERSATQTCRTVQEDWRAALPAGKAEVFRSSITGLEGLHIGFGVVLNEALQGRKAGQADRAREQVSISADLCERVAGPLADMLSALERHARHFGTLPSVDPLSPENFRGDVAKQIAWRNETLSRVLWQQHKRFLHKLRSLGEIAHQVALSYRAVATRLAEGSSLAPQQDWSLLDCAHFDLSTALSEAQVLLKSFLVALPEEEVPFFREALVTSLSPTSKAAVAAQAIGRPSALRRQ